MYHYTEAGLQNVWLANGYHVKKTKYGEAVSIEDAKGLHRAIGRHLAQKRYLTGAEFRFLRKELDLPQRRVADLVGTSEQTVALWEKRGKIPETADRIFRAIYLETIDGNVKIKEFIEAIADLDRKVEEKKLIFQDTEAGWLPNAA
jgi:DNA-binding transcriptional regulator YiaG